MTRTLSVFAVSAERHTNAVQRWVRQRSISAQNDGISEMAIMPNEYMVIDPKEGSKVLGLTGIEKFYVDLLFALGEAR